MTQEEMGAGVRFETLEDKLRELLGGKKMSRPLIYRYLKALEESSILKVNRDVNPNLYMVSFESIIQAIDRSRTNGLAELESSLKQIETEEISLRNLDRSWLARRLLLRLSGKPERVGTKTARGLMEAHFLIDNEIYSRAMEGDTIRVTLDWFTLSERAEIERQAAGLRLAVKGVLIKSLQYFPERVSKDVVRLRYNRLKDLRDKGIEADYRIANRSARTYQGVALNKDSIALVVAEEPLTLVWIPRVSNAALIDEAVSSYDRDFENGIDFLEYYKEEFDEQ